MKVIDSIRSMFTNKEEVIDLKKRNITSSLFIHSNDRFLKMDGNGSFIWLSIFNKDLYLEFIQISETLPLFRSYLFSNEFIILVPLQIVSMEYILTNMRYINNPFYQELCKCISQSIPKDLIKQDVIESTDLKNYKFISRSMIENDIDDDFEEIKKDSDSITELYQNNLFAKRFGVKAYDNTKQIKKLIVDTVPKLAPYISNYDINTLCRILFSYGDVTVSMTYQELLLDMEKYIQTSTDYGFALYDFATMIRMDEYKDEFDLNLEDSKPAIVQVNKESDDVDEVISTEMIDYNLPDTSKIDKSKYIT